MSNPTDNIIRLDKVAPIKRVQKRIAKDRQVICKEISQSIQQAEILMRKLLHKYVTPQEKRSSDNAYFLLMVHECLLGLKKQTVKKQSAAMRTISVYFDPACLSYLNHRINCVESLVRVGMVESLMEEMGNDMAYSVMALHELLIKIQKLLEKL